MGTLEKMMISIVTAKRLKQIFQKHYELGIAKGYELGYRMAKCESSNLGFIIGTRINGQLEEKPRREGS
jgi:hypothetical protein